MYRYKCYGSVATAYTLSNLEASVITAVCAELEDAPWNYDDWIVEINVFSESDDLYHTLSTARCFHIERYDCVESDIMDEYARLGLSFLCMHV